MNQARHRWYTGIGISVALVVCAMAMIAPAPVRAESSIVVLGAQSKSAHRQFVDGFKAYLAGEDEDVAFVDMALEDAFEDTEGLKEFIGNEHVPLVLTLGPKAFTAAVTQEVEQPLLAGLTRDSTALGRHDNATGVVLDYKVETQLAWIRRILPDIRTIGVLYNPDQSGRRVAAAKKAAKKLGLEFVAQEVSSPTELPVAMESLFRRVDVLWGITDPVVLTRQTAKAILLTSFRNKVPFIAPSSAWVKAGALYSLEFDYGDIGAQTGEMAREIMGGRQVKSMQPQEPRRVRYALNLRTAEHMRLKLPGEIVDGAAQVFE